MGNLGSSVVYNLVFRLETVIILFAAVGLYHSYRKQSRSSIQAATRVAERFMHDIRTESDRRANKPIKSNRYNKYEERCREILERIFRRKFPSVRPDFLKNPGTGRNLELDGYCSSIGTPYGHGLAFEYDGIQHAKYTPRFHASPKHFAGQVQRDRFKTERCRRQGIVLIRIPHYIAYHDLDRFIRQKLLHYNIRVI